LQQVNACAVTISTSSCSALASRRMRTFAERFGGERPDFF
jgi:hypothetical protein